ncbi:hypothetical protein [Kitasatospora aureofaciens]|uniref:hypothetical protein n=1 Tax=Kitasatospora aureofaciens TaxID=1894 RepID=UPI000527E4D5|nr:hypothetical protein [Kitasatospora aureofaciens]
MNSEDPGTTLAQRIESLRRATAPEGGRPLSDAEVATAIADAGGKVNGNTLYRLRTGMTRNPTMETLMALARWGGVTPGFFFPGAADDPVRYREIEAALERPDVRRLALRLADMAPDKVAALERLLEAP